MSVITLLGIGVGIGATIDIGGRIVDACTEDDRARERIKQLEAENEQLNLAKNYVSGIKTKLSSAKEYLTDAQNDFKNGGYVLYNQPLAFKNFNGCIGVLEGAIVNATKLINDLDTTIAQNNNDIRTEQAKLN